MMEAKTIGREIMGFVGKVVVPTSVELVALGLMESVIKPEHLLSSAGTETLMLTCLVGVSRHFARFVKNRMDSMDDLNSGDPKGEVVKREEVIKSIVEERGKRQYDFGGIIASLVLRADWVKDEVGARAIINELWMSKNPRSLNAKYVEGMIKLIQQIQSIEGVAGEVRTNPEYRDSLKELVEMGDLLESVRVNAGKGIKDWVLLKYGEGSMRKAFVKGGAIAAIGLAGVVLVTQPETIAAREVVEKRQLGGLGDWGVKPDRGVQILKATLVEIYPEMSGVQLNTYEKWLKSSEPTNFVALALPIIAGRYFEVDGTIIDKNQVKFEQYVRNYWMRMFSYTKAEGLDPMLMLEMMRLGAARNLGVINQDQDVIEGRIQAILGANIQLLERLGREELGTDLNLEEIVRGIMANPVGGGPTMIQRELGPETGGIFDMEALMIARAMANVIPKNEQIWEKFGITAEIELEDLLRCDQERERQKTGLNDAVIEFIMKDNPIKQKLFEERNSKLWDEIGLGQDPSVGEICTQIGRYSEIYRIWITKWKNEGEDYRKKLILDSFTQYKSSILGEAHDEEGGELSAMRRLILGQLGNNKFIEWMDGAVDINSRSAWRQVKDEYTALRRNGEELTIRQRRVFADLGLYEYDGDFQLRTAVAYVKYLETVRDAYLLEHEHNLVDQEGISLRKLVSQSKEWRDFTTILLREIAPISDMTAVTLNHVVSEAGVDLPYNPRETLYWLNQLVYKLGKIHRIKNDASGAELLMIELTVIISMHEKREVEELQKMYSLAEWEEIVPIIDHMDLSLYSAYHDADVYIAGLSKLV